VFDEERWILRNLRVAERRTLRGMLENVGSAGG
jgi:hypothetical protein